MCSMLPLMPVHSNQSLLQPEFVITEFVITEVPYKRNIVVCISLKTKFINAIRWKNFRTIGRLRYNRSLLYACTNLVSYFNLHCLLFHSQLMLNIEISVNSRKLK